jgi:hypothetical protein
VAFYAHISMRGPIKRGVVPGSIGVLEAPDRFMPIGQAHCFRWDDRGFAVWRLNVGGHDLPGEWIVVDREFRPAARDEDGQASGVG